jgi:preprotein translocase subunit YajC
LAQLIVIVAMFALLWLFLIAPQRRRAQAQQSLIEGVEVGDEILTVGGLYGHVEAIDDEGELEVEIAPGLRVRVARRAVAAVVPPEDEDEAGEEDVEEAVDAEDADEALGAPGEFEPKDANRS